MPNALNYFSVLLQVAEELALTVKSSKARVIDLCCGVGICTREKERAVGSSRGATAPSRVCTLTL
jgi:ubiquinone/menaquinone biosynthesis C-methylase UbiE